MFSLEDLNSKFGTNYKYNSQMERSINRGLKRNRSDYRYKNSRKMAREL